MGRTKCTKIVKNIGKCVMDELVSNLRKHKFSVIVDEATHVTLEKSLGVVVKYYDDTVISIKTGMLQLLHLENSSEGLQGSTGKIFITY